MTIRTKIICAVAMSGFAAFAAMSPAQALTTQECSAKYQAAKTAGTLGGQKWNDFRKAQCGADAAAATPAAAPAAAPKEAKKDAAPAVAAAPSGPAVYPSAVDPKYSTRMPVTAIRIMFMKIVIGILERKMQMRCHGRPTNR